MSNVKVLKPVEVNESVLLNEWVPVAMAVGRQVAMSVAADKVAKKVSEDKQIDTDDIIEFTEACAANYHGDEDESHTDEGYMKEMYEKMYENWKAKIGKAVGKAATQAATDAASAAITKKMAPKESFEVTLETELFLLEGEVNISKRFLQELEKRSITFEKVNEMNGFQSKALIKAVMKEAKPSQKLSLQDKSRNINFLFTKMSDDAGWFCNTGPKEHKNKKVDAETAATLFSKEGSAMGIELDGTPLKKFNYKFKGRDANASVIGLTIESVVNEEMDEKQLLKHLEAIKKTMLKDDKRNGLIDYIEIQDGDLLQIGYSVPEQDIKGWSADWNYDGIDFSGSDFKKRYDKMRPASIEDVKPKDAYRTFVDRLSEEMMFNGYPSI